MKERPLYLVLCVVGLVAPYAVLAPWLAEHGLDVPLLLHAIVTQRVAAFFAVDLVISAVTLWLLIWFQRRSLTSAAVWLPVIATLLVGVSLGLPLYLYLRGGNSSRAQ